MAKDRLGTPDCNLTMYSTGYERVFILVFLKMVDKEFMKGMYCKWCNSRIDFPG